MEEFGTKMGAKILPKSVKESIPKHVCTKGPVGSDFSSQFVSLYRTSKTGFSLQRGAKNHMFTKFSLFFRPTPNNYKQNLKTGVEICPKHPQINLQPE